MRRVLAELETHGVEEADVQTTGLPMYPEYEYHAYSPPTLVGLPGHPAGQVRRRRAGRGRHGISAAVECGGNGVRVSDIRLGIADPDAVLSRARDAAVESATAKAEQYAAATGQSLGDVVSIREVGRPAQPRTQPQFVLIQTFDGADAGQGAADPGRQGRPGGTDPGGVGLQVGRMANRESSHAAIGSRAWQRRTT